MKKPIIIVIACFVLVMSYGLAWQLKQQKDSNKQSNPVDNGTENISVNNSSTDSFPIIEPNLFQINIPEKFTTTPRIEKQEIKSANNSESATLTVYSYNTDLYTYNVGFARYPSEIFKRKSQEAILNDLRNGQVRDFNGSLKRESTSYDAHNMLTRELLIKGKQLNKDKFIRSLLIISDPFIFMVNVSADNESSLYKPKANQFFDSLNIFHQNHDNQVVIVNN